MLDLISSLIERTRSFLDAPPKPTETLAIPATSFDREDWAAVRDASPAMQQLEYDLGATVDHVGDFMQDLHSSFFKYEPRVRSRDDMETRHRANRDVVEQLLGMPEVQALRTHTAGDAYSSAIAMNGMGETVTTTLANVRSAEADARQRQEEAEQRAEQARQDLAEALQQAQDDPHEADPEIIDALADQLAQHEGAAHAADQAAGRAGQQAISAGKQAMRRTAQAATEQLDQEAALCSAFGVDPGELQRMDVRERMTLGTKLRGNRLAEFAKLIGAFKQVQKAQSRKRITNAASEVHGVTFSDDLTRLTAGEYLNFADPTLETLFLQRFTEHQLLTYDVRGKERLGQGPIVFVGDESSSMSSADVGGQSREAWCKGLALAMLDQARHRKRDFVYIGFSSAGRMRMVEFPHGEGSFDRVIEMTETMLGGGTHYETPLNAALDLIEKRYDGDTTHEGRPDIVFATDDAYRELPPEFMATYNRVKDKASITVYGIAIGCAYSGALAQISDNVRAITDLLSDPANIGDLFQTI